MKKGSSICIIQISFLILLEAAAVGEDGSVDIDNGTWAGLATSFGVTGADDGLATLLYER